MCSSFTPWRGQWTVTRPTSIELSLQSCQTTSRFETPRPRFADRGLTRPQHLFGVRSSILSGEPVLPMTHFRSEEHTSELQSLMRISYAVFCLKKKKKQS